jgi:hypothetical protein
MEKSITVYAIVIIIKRLCLFVEDRVGRQGDRERGREGERT